MNTNCIETYRVAIIGGGPAGLGVASGLARRGIAPVIIIERRDELGGVPARYKEKSGSVPTFIDWTTGRVLVGQKLADKLVRSVEGTDTETLLQTQVLAAQRADNRLTLVNPQRGRFQIVAEAIVMCCGAREKTTAERGWISGSRAARTFFTRHLIEFLDQHGKLPVHQPVILGSDLIAYSAAAKLRAAAGGEAQMLDQQSRRQTSLAARLYFRRWANPSWRGGVQDATFNGSMAIRAITAAGGPTHECDGAVLCGELVPNTELALLGGFNVKLPGRELVIDESQQLSSTGWFAAGNILGGFRGAHWCYFNGRRLSRGIARYLKHN